MVKNLKLLRQSTGVSQQKLADEIMVSQQSVNKYENHNVEPDIETLVKIADFFDVSIDYLVGRCDVKEMAQDIDEKDLSAKEINLIKLYRSLTDKQKECVDTVAKSYK